MAVSTIKAPSLYRFVFITKTVTVPANGNLTVDFGTELNGKSILSGYYALNNRPLPYVTNGGVIETWITTTSGSSITIRNIGGAWTNYNLYAFIATAY